jgi:hypothetical protein
MSYKYNIFYFLLLTHGFQSHKYNIFYFLLLTLTTFHRNPTYLSVIKKLPPTLISFCAPLFSPFPLSTLSTDRITPPTTTTPNHRSALCSSRLPPSPHTTAQPTPQNRRASSLLTAVSTNQRTKVDLSRRLAPSVPSSLAA